MLEGKLPPQAIDLEEAVIGAAMLESKCVPELLSIIKPESFYKDSNEIIFEAIINLHNRSEPIDILTVTVELKGKGKLNKVGGPYYITQLTNRVASAANVEFHARLVQQKYLQREWIKLATKIQGLAYSEGADVFDIAECAEKGLSELSKHLSLGKVSKLGSQWDEIENKNAKLLENKGVSGVESGLKALDEITGGFQDSDLIIIAARPAMGKTALAVNFMRNASVLNDKPVLMFSLEMNALQLAIRSFSIESGETIAKFSRIGIEPEQMIMIKKDCKRLIDSNFFIDDTAGISIQELRAKARKFKRENNIELIVVDYLQLMQGEKKGNREQEISSISRGLKELAKELNIPVIALSQLSRSVESRGGDKRPMLSDLRESGAIEQDADVVMFVHRPEYYGMTEDENNESTIGMAELIIAKHRNGGIGTAKVSFDAKRTKFGNYGESEEMQNDMQQNSDFLNENKSKIN